jgi:Domain of unknown function (DUF397)
VVSISQPIHNGMPAADLAWMTWRKSRHSGQLGNCVETAALPGGEVAVRNSPDPGGPASIFSRDQMAAFLAGTKEAESDDYAG